MESFKQPSKIRSSHRKPQISNEGQSEKLKRQSDSNLVTKQVNEVFQAREMQMQKYYHLVK